MNLPNNTMVYVYRLPEQMSDGYCFGGGVPITFVNVDWFNGFDGMTRADLEYRISRKRYLVPGQTFLVCSPENDISFTFKVDKVALTGVTLEEEG